MFCEALVILGRSVLGLLRKGWGLGQVPGAQVVWLYLWQLKHYECACISVEFLCWIEITLESPSS